MQIDLLVDRADNVVNMCTLKFYGGEFVVDRDYYITLMNRETALKKEMPKKTTVRSTLITTFGLVRIDYSDIFTNVILLDDLFS